MNSEEAVEAFQTAVEEVPKKGGLNASYNGFVA